MGLTREEDEEEEAEGGRGRGFRGIYTDAAAHIHRVSPKHWNNGNERCFLLMMIKRAGVLYCYVMLCRN